MSSSIHALLAQQKEEILRRWRNKTRDALGVERMPRKELLDSLPLFFDSLLTALARPDEAPPPEVPPVASRHGTERLRMGYSLSEMISEYGMLRDSLFEVLAEHRATPTMGEYLLLWRCFTSAVAEGVAGYSRERDADLEQETARHLAFLAHELRNPLASAVVAVALVRHKAPDSVGAAMRVLERSLSRLGTLVDNSLVEMRLRTGVALRKEKCDLQEVVQSAAAESALDAEARRITVSTQAEDGLILNADPRFLRSAVTNLLRNAIKYTHEGGTVQLRARMALGHFRIEVEDECGGLPDGAAEKMFGPFVQLGRDRSGFGLGLAIAQQAAQAHGGSIVVHNLQGVGCVFTLDLPPDSPSVE